MSEQIWICAVCCRVLDNYANNDGAGARHTEYDASRVDHEAVPIPHDATVKPYCDFCQSDEPQWTLPATDFEAVPGHDYVGDWAACDPCADLITDGQWSLLAIRAAQSYYERSDDLPMPELPLLLSTLYEQLREHVTGPIYRDQEQS